jgi:pheromone shutdown protein TraB
MESETGGEMLAAVKEGRKLGSHIILGDRCFSVTISRALDKLNFFDLVKYVGFALWELASFRSNDLKEFIEKTESGEVSSTNSL